MLLKNEKILHQKRKSGLRLAISVIMVASFGPIYIMTENIAANTSEVLGDKQ